MMHHYPFGSLEKPSEATIIMLLALFSDSEKPNKELLYWSVSFVSFNMVLNNFTSKLKIDKGKGEKAPSLLVLNKPSKSGAVAVKKQCCFLQWVARNNLVSVAYGDKFHYCG